MLNDFGISAKSKMAAIKIFLKDKFYLMSSRRLIVLMWD